MLAAVFLVMLAAVFLCYLIGFLVSGGLYYPSRWSLLNGFVIGSMMVVGSNSSRMNGVGNRCNLINSQIFFFFFVGYSTTWLWHTIFLLQVDMLFEIILSGEI